MRTIISMVPVFLVASIFVGCSQSDGSVSSQPPETTSHIAFKVMAEADWNETTGVFITIDGYKWQRSDESGASNLSAAVYASAGWNTLLKEQARYHVTTTQATPEDTNGWDLLVYDQYENSDLFDTWIQKYGHADGTYNAEKIRELYKGYDSYGTVIGLYRAHKKGVMTQENFDTNIAAIQDRLLSLSINEEDYAYFRLIETETGIHIHDYPESVDTAGFDMQSFAFAVRAYGPEGVNLSQEAVEEQLISNAKVAQYSVESIDNMAVYYMLLLK